MMKQHIRDQRGVAMILEIVLVAVVLALAGAAVYQANHHGSTASLTSQSKAPSSVEGLAASAAAVTEQDTTADANISASADAATNEVMGADDDLTNLGDSFDENNF